MLTVSPSDASLASAAPVAPGDYVLSMHGWNTAVKASDADRYQPIRKNVSRKWEGANAYFDPAPTLTADDIPWDYPEHGTFKSYPTQIKFVHRPVVTYRRGDVVEVVTGPVDPTVPHTTPATELGWQKFFSDEKTWSAEQKAAGDERCASVRRYFQKRHNDKEAKWADKCKRALEKGKPLPKRPRPAPPDAVHFVKDEPLKSMISASRSIEETARRMREFRHRGSIPMGDRVYAPFGEAFTHADGTNAPAIRSWLGPISLKLFSSALSKNVNYGYDKEIEYSSWSTGLLRLDALDMPYVVLDKNRRCAFVVDLDGWWESAAALRAHLRKFLPAHLMPNIATYRGRESDGQGVENPHLVWVLPPGSRVIPEKGKDKRNQFRLHSMVQTGIVSLLIDVGADPGHTNADKTKSPLAAYWSIETCDDHFATMDDWRAFLPTITPNTREMQRRAKVHKAAQQSGTEVSRSMAIWNDGLAFRRLEIKAAQRRRDPAFLQAIKQHATFVDWLYHPVSGGVTKRLIKVHGDTKAVRSVLLAQREFVQQQADTPGAVGEFCNRGRDRDYLPSRLGPMATAEEREAAEKKKKAEAGRRTRRGLEAVHCGLIAAEIERRRASGIEVVKAEVVNALVKAGTVSRSVAYAHYDHVLQTVRDAARYQDHYLDIVTKQADSITESAPVFVQKVEFGRSVERVTVDSTMVMSPEVRDPAKTTESDRPALTRRKLKWCMEQAAQLDSWMCAVAEWREALRQLPDDNEHDLVDDPAFHAMVVERSSWWHHQRRH